MQQHNDLKQALEALSEALEENNRRNQQIQRRIAKMRRLLAKGTPLSGIVSEEDRPLIVELLSQNMEVLTTAGTRLRRTEARALHAEGLPMQRIARLFGVSRQRISELLRQANGESS